MPSANDLFQIGYDTENQALKDLRGSQSAFSGLNTTNAIQNRFGLSGGSNKIFQPLYRNLAAQRQGALSRASARSGGSATKEGSLFTPIEQGYATAEGGLESEQARTDVQLQQFIANLLQGSLGEQDRFSLQKSGMEQSGGANLANLALNKQQTDFSTQGPGFMDYVMKILSAGAPVVGAAIQKPPTTNNYY